MESFALGFPPDGQSVDPSGSSNAPIPEPIRSAVVEQFEELYPTGYVLAFADSEADIFGFYTRSSESWRRISTTASIGIYPTKPAKGGGYVLLGHQDQEGQWPDIYLGSSQYTPAIHDWMRTKAEALSTITGVPIQEFPAGCDA